MKLREHNYIIKKSHLEQTTVFCKNTYTAVFSQATKASFILKHIAKNKLRTMNHHLWPNSSKYQKVEDKRPPLKFNFRGGLFCFTF